MCSRFSRDLFGRMRSVCSRFSRVRIGRVATGIPSRCVTVGRASSLAIPARWLVGRPFSTGGGASGQLLAAAVETNAAVNKTGGGYGAGGVDRGGVAAPHGDAWRLIAAVRGENWNEARRLVHGVRVPVDAQDRATERTALTDAAARGHHAGMRFLIDELGANPHLSCDCAKGHRHTALHYAAERGDAAGIELLLRRGSNPHLVSEHGQTPAQLLPAHATPTARLLIAAALATQPATQPPKATQPAKATIPNKPGYLRPPR